MQEDVMGPRADSFGPKYTTCSECGRSFPRSLMHTEPASVLEGARSEIADLCADCERLDSMGERPVLTGAEDDA